jgi:hypothetical protein
MILAVKPTIKSAIGKEERNAAQKVLGEVLESRK